MNQIIFHFYLPNKYLDGKFYFTQQHIFNI